MLRRKKKYKRSDNRGSSGVQSAGLETGIQKAAPGVYLGDDKLLWTVRAMQDAEGSICASARNPVTADAAVG